MAALLALAAGVGGAWILNDLGGIAHEHRHHTSAEYWPMFIHWPAGLLFGSLAAIALLRWVLTDTPWLARVGWLFPLKGLWLRILLAALLWTVAMIALTAVVECILIMAPGTDLTDLPAIYAGGFLVWLGCVGWCIRLLSPVDRHDL